MPCVIQVETIVSVIDSNDLHNALSPLAMTEREMPTLRQKLTLLTALVAGAWVLTACASPTGVPEETKSTASEVVIHKNGFEPRPAVPPTVLGSNWHFDSDGDGIATSGDICPWTYDPQQGDLDGDGLGNACDPDYAPPTQGGAVTDLHAEHVTPFGGWFSFTSPHNAEWGWDGVLAWSTNAADLSSVSGIESLRAQQQSIDFEVTAYFGTPLAFSVRVTAMDPSLTYFVAMTKENWDGLDSQISNIIQIQTHAAPAVNLSSTYPRAFANSAVIGQWQQRHNSGDPDWQAWESIVAGDIDEAVAGSEWEAWRFCLPAGTLYAVTGDSNYLAAGQSLFQEVLSHWQGQNLSDNQFRWADAQLGYCLDVMWDHLTPTQRNTAATEILDEDEDELGGRFEDTDQWASSVRSFLVDGIVLCDAPGLDSDLAQRGCAILDQGIRRWYGGMQVLARRDRGAYANSGGYLPDGAYYGHGTFGYWIEAFWAAQNAGLDQSEYGPYVANNLFSMKAHAATPMGRGFTTIGDVEGFVGHFSVEPNSFPFSESQSGAIAFQVGLLDRLGQSDAASVGRWHLNRYYPDSNGIRRFHRLLFDHDGVPEKTPEEVLDTSFFESGWGLLVDRTSWNSNATMLMASGGWRGVDHTHADVGHFQFYRKGRWITHEILGYGDTAMSAAGHNVLRLQIPHENGSDTVSQYLSGDQQQRQTGVSTSVQHSFVSFDTTGAYSSQSDQGFYYDSVQRAVAWIKGNGGVDTLFLFDLINVADSAPASLQREYFLHLFEAPPNVNGQSATMQFPATPTAQRADFRVVLPASGVSLQALGPNGAPNDYPSLLYADRLRVNPGNGQDLRMLSVLRVADSGDTPTAAAWSWSGSNWLVAGQGDHIALFPRNGYYQAPDSGVGVLPNYLNTACSGIWSGLQPGASYTITPSTSGSDIHLTLSPGGAMVADSGGVIHFEVTASGTVN